MIFGQVKASRVAPVRRLFLLLVGLSVVFSPAALAFAVISLLNALLRPILIKLSIKPRLPTLVFLALSLNATAIWLTYAFVPGIAVSGEWVLALLALAMTGVNIAFSDLFSIDDDDSYYHHLVSRMVKLSGQPQQTDRPGVVFLEIDGLAAIVSMRMGEWARIYIADTASPEQADAFGSLIPLALPFLGMGVIETVEVVPLSIERTETMLKYASHESAVQIDIVMGANGEPIRIANLPMKGSHFPEVHGHTQYRAAYSKHRSEGHQFEWEGRNGFTSTIDLAGDLPDEGP